MEYNEALAYKRIFECAQNVGINKTVNLFKEMEELRNVDLLRWAVIGGAHKTLSLTKSNQDVVNYLREYKQDLRTLLFDYDLLIKSLEGISEETLKTYIENMRKLEKLKIGRVSVVELRKLLSEYYYFEIIRLSQTRAKVTKKYYSDGKLKLDDSDTLIGNKIRRLFELEDKKTTFLLKVNRTQKIEQRTIEITGFDFNGQLLPSEGELSSYDIPYTLKLTK